MLSHALIGMLEGQHHRRLISTGIITPSIEVSFPITISTEPVYHRLMTYTVAITIEGEEGGYIHKASNLLGVINLLSNHIAYTTGDIVEIPELVGKYGKSDYSNEYIDDITEALE